MRRKVKTSAVILSAALAFSFVCGCGGEAAAPVTESVETDDPGEGLGDMITDEDQLAETDEEPAVNELALKGPSYTGLSNLYTLNNEDGTYIYEDMTEDGLTVIRNMCSHNSQRDGQDPDAYAENYVCALVDETDSAKIIDSADDETLSESLTYPTYRIHWESGSNEDSRQNVGVVVLTDNITFYYGYGCPVDYYEDNANFYESELYSIELIDLADLEVAPAGDAEDTEETGDSDNAYGALYLDKINELKNGELADQFALEYIDKDEIPELIASDSAGSFDHVNAFIFTIHNGEVVELASVIAGVDGGSLDFAKEMGLIHVSGSAAGMRDVFSEIKDGKLEEVFTAEASSMDENAKYSINGSNVKEEEYYEQINGFLEGYNPLIRIDYEGLYEVNYKYEDGYGYFEQGDADPYSSFDEITKDLK
ncbi:MAG: hypothetical protein K6A71_03470 [Lachnospiraceae bacterium]|nr:hypothetical protein [Lachnospiraceae bacterium]